MNSPKNKRKKLFVRIMCGFLAFLIAGSSLLALLEVF